MHLVLLTWNDREAVLQCLKSVRASGQPDLQVLIVDNASQDDTVTAVRSEFPDYRVIVNDRNLGFAAGCNVGLRVALAEQAEFILLLNQDTVVAPDLFQQLLAAAQRYPKAGILGPKTYFLAKAAEGQERLLYGGSWRGRLPLQQHLPGIEQIDDGTHNTACPVDFVWGHGLFLRAAMLRNIGLFDEAFFMYYEDLDLCRRATEAGYEIWYIPQALMWHDISDGSRVTTAEGWRFRYKTQSMLAFYKKHYGLWRGHILTWLNVTDEARQFWQRGETNGAKTLWQAWFQTLAKTRI
jgi:GT2 family glycosyltransferase